MLLTANLVVNEERKGKHIKNKHNKKTTSQNAATGVTFIPAWLEDSTDNGKQVACGMSSGAGQVLTRRRQGADRFAYVRLDMIKYDDIGLHVITYYYSIATALAVCS